MRLLLDAHLSGRHIAGPLRELGHDVLSADEERSLEGASDVELLELATRESRILVTFDVKDFLPIAREWAEAGRHHSGLIVGVGMATNEFKLVVTGINNLLVRDPAPEAWTDAVLFLARS